MKGTTTTRKGIDRHFFPLSLAFVAMGVAGTVIAASLPEMKAEFEVDNARISSLFVCWGVGVIAGSLLGGRSLRSQPDQRLLGVAAAIGCLASWSLASEQDFTLFRMWITVLGMVVGVLVTRSHGIVARGSESSQAATVGFLDFALSAGAVATPLLINHLESGGLGDGTSWRDAFSVAFALFAAFWAVSVFGHADPVPAPSGNGARQRRGVRFDISPFLATCREPVFVYTVLVSLAVHSIEYGHSYWFVTYGMSIDRISADQAREVLGIFLLGMVVSRIVLSWLIGIVDARAILATLVSATLGIVVFLPSYTEFASLYVVNFLFGAALGGIFPAALAVSFARLRGSGAALSGAALIAGTIGGKATAVGIGYLGEGGAISDMYVVIGVVAALLYVCAMLFALDGRSSFVGKGKRRPTDVVEGGEK